jgi:hypothetical protein
MSEVIRAWVDSTDASIATLKRHPGDPNSSAIATLIRFLGLPAAVNDGRACCLESGGPLLALLLGLVQLQYPDNERQKNLHLLRKELAGGRLPGFGKEF